MVPNDLALSLNYICVRFWIKYEKLCCRYLIQHNLMNYEFSLAIKSRATFSTDKNVFSCVGNMR